MQKLLKIGQYLLVLMALGFVVLLGLMQTALVPGYEVRIVQSGSMEPALHTGGLVLIKAENAYAIGDIVTFGRESAGSLPTTHRIIADQIQNGELVFETKGDANPDPDQELLAADDIRGKVIFSLPYLGYLLDFARHPLGFVLLIGIPALIIVVEEVSKIVAELRGRRRKDNEEVPKKTS